MAALPGEPSGQARRTGAMKKLLIILLWVGVAITGAAGLGAIAFERKEPINATWFVIAAVCCYLLGYRF